MRRSILRFRIRPPGLATDRNVAPFRVGGAVRSPLPLRTNSQRHCERSAAIQSKENNTGLLPPSLSELRRTRSSQGLLAMTWRRRRTITAAVANELSTSLRAKRGNPGQRKQDWIASSQELLAMTWRGHAVTTFAGGPLNVIVPTVSTLPVARKADWSRRRNLPSLRFITADHDPPTSCPELPVARFTASACPRSGYRSGRRPRRSRCYRRGG